MKLEFQLETEINKPLQEVIRLYADRSQYPRWQPGLVNIEPVPGQPHPTYELLLEFGRRKMKMKETVLADRLPQHYEVHYKTKGVENHVMSSFEAITPATTRWISKEQFHFKGLMNLVAVFMKDSFKKQSSIIMNNFKRYAEKA